MEIQNGRGRWGKAAPTAKADAPSAPAKAAAKAAAGAAGADASERLERDPAALAAKVLTGPARPMLTGIAEISPHTKVKVYASPPVKSDPRSMPDPALPVFYHPGYKPAAGIGRHVMPIDKFGLLARALETSGVPVKVREPPPIGEADIARVHSQAYVEAIKTGEPRALAESSTFQWSPGLYDSVRLTSGGEHAAAREALDNGEFAFALVSGFHHARPDRGDGFCTFNGLAITAKKLIADGEAERVLIIDNDFHYGNGTAHAAAGGPGIFTYSVFGQGWDYRPESEHNVRKLLPAGTKLSDYLGAQADLQGIIERFQPDLILYQAGMDPLRTDALSGGTFDVGHADLKQRDKHMFELAKRNEVPIVVNLAGGYSRDVFEEPSPVVVGHLNTYLAALEVFRGYKTDLEVPAHARA